jgi:hypothetical protein
VGYICRRDGVASNCERHQRPERGMRKM